MPVIEVAEVAKKTVEAIGKATKACSEISKQKEIVRASLTKALGMEQNMKNALRVAEKTALAKSMLDEYT